MPEAEGVTAVGELAVSGAADMRGEPERAVTRLRIDACARCGRRFEQPRKKGRPRRYCDRDDCVAPAPPATSIDTDPPIRADGSCVVCGKSRQTDRSRRYAGGAATADPFCSNTCARSWYDNPVPSRSIWERDHGAAA